MDNLPRPAEHERRVGWAGKKQVHTTTVETLLYFFSGSEASMVYALLSGPMVHTLFLCFSRKMVYTVAFLLCDLRVGRQTEKGGLPLWWCMLFCPRLNDGFAESRRHENKRGNLERLWYLCRPAPFLIFE